jgi:cell wall-associated NlpC family hydrolase
MAASYRSLIVAAVGAALLLAGCAGAPPPRSKPRVVIEPLPGVARNPQEMAIEQGLGDFYGAPYRSGGTTPAGVDCSGLVQALYHKAGINLPRTVAQQFQEGKPVERGQLRFGDVVFFNRYCQTRGREVMMAGFLIPGFAEQVCHDGIYLGGGRFIHASPRGVFISRLDAQVWQKAYRGARRYLPTGD